jgi:hypothetical protein
MQNDKFIMFLINNKEIIKFIIGFLGGVFMAHLVYTLIPKMIIKTENRPILGYVMRITMLVVIIYISSFILWLYK